MYVSSTIQVEIYFVLRSTYYVLGVPVAAVFRFCNTKQTFFYNELLYQVLVYQQLLNTPEYCYSCRHKSHRTRQHARCADLRLWGQTSYQSAPSSCLGGQGSQGDSFLIPVARTYVGSHVRRDLEVLRPIFS